MNSIQLPDNWEKLLISQVTIRTRQRDPRKAPSTPFRYVDVSSVSNTSFSITGATELLGSDAPSRARKEIQTDDILFATVRPTLKRIANAVDQIDYGISAPIPKTPPENGIKTISTADIKKDGRLLYDQIRRITVPEKTIKRLTLQTGDVLFNWRNSAELIGKSAIFQSQDEPHVFASFILRIKCGEKTSHNYFLMHLMNYYLEIGVFLKLSRRAVNQANYNRNEISVLKIPLPGYKEQREIADIIEVVDEKLEFHRRKHAALSDLFRTLLHELMTAQIRIHNISFDGYLKHVER